MVLKDVVLLCLDLFIRLTASKLCTLSFLLLSLRIPLIINARLVKIAAVGYPYIHIHMELAGCVPDKETSPRKVINY